MPNPAELTIAHVNLSRTLGAPQLQTVLLIKYLAGLGVKQMLVCRANSPLIAALRGVAGVTLLKLTGNDLRLQGHLKLARRFTLVHAHDWLGAQWAFLHYLMFAVPYVVSTRDAEIKNEGLFSKAILLWARGVVSSSEAAAAKLKEEFELDDVRVIASCISELRSNPSNVFKIRDSFSDRFIVGQVAPLVNRKYAQTLLIDAARILQQRIPTIVVLFIGEGDDGRLLTEHAHGMSNIKFIDAKFSMLPDYIKAMDVFVCPANVGGSMTLQTTLDALDLGTPVVTTDLEGVRTYIENGKSGLIVPKGDAEALAGAILRIRDEPQLKAILRENGKYEAQKLSPEIMAMQYYDLYRYLLRK